MPYLALQTSSQIAANQQNPLAIGLSKIVAESLGKPETYVMVSVSSGTMCMAGTTEPSAFVDLRSIGGLSGATNALIADRICGFLETELSIPPNRTYLNFTDMARETWGFDKRTF